MSEALRLTMWAVHDQPNESPYRAPEARRKVFTGLRPDGQRVETAPIAEKLTPRTFLCGDETIELVGDAEPGYVAFCESIGRPIDPDDPIRMIAK